MTQPRSGLSILLLTMSVLLAPDLALAHTGTGDLNGFFSGFEHPIFGPDHLVAMLAVGLWGAQLGNPALWVLPITFPLVMAFGGVMGVSGVELPFLETVIAMSGLVLGLAVAFSWPAPLWLAGCIVALFAIFHGNAHGLELPEAASPLAYAVGFVLATGMIHLCGIGIGTLSRWPVGERVVRAGGLAVAALGLWYLLPTGA